MNADEIAAVRERLVYRASRVGRAKHSDLKTQGGYHSLTSDLDDALAALDALVEQNATIAARVKAMVDWLEREQPDVFRRGLWDAISEVDHP